MLRKPKAKPTAASENDTGKPISMNRIIPANISGAITSKVSMRARRLVERSLQRLLVMGVERVAALQRRDPLDQLREPLQREQGEANRRQQLDRPADHA